MHEVDKRADVELLELACLLRALDVLPDEALRRLVAARRKRCPETSEQRRIVTNFSLNA